MSLRSKLLGTFALIILVTLAAVAFMANRVTQNEFAHLPFQGQMATPADVRDILVQYYRQFGSWQGVQEVLIAGRTPMMGGMMNSSRIVVVDPANRQIVGDSRGALVGEPASAAMLEAGEPIEVDGQTVGILWLQGVMSMPMGGQEQAAVLQRVNRGVVLAAGIAGLVAFLISILFVRQITRPLQQLAGASRQIAAGNLVVRVPVSGHDELGQVGHAFNHMAESLQTQEQLRRHLVADVAHELRTPLTVIQGQVEALQDGVIALTPDALAPIHNSVSLLGRLVDDLRTVAQADAGQLVLDRQPLDLGALAGQVADDMLAPAAAAGITLTLETAAGIPVIQGDAQRLRQVLLNLLHNALRHTPPGGVVTVRVAPASSPTTPPAAARPAVVLSVIDSGPGIAPDDLPYIFDRFYRGDRARSRDTGGSGLGLTIARQIVTAHGGTITVQSPANPAGGTAFVVELAA